MQTFLPYPDFAQCAAVLDRKRLCKQRVETKQVYKALKIGGKGWIHHPAVKMWAGYENALLQYGICMCQQWIAYGCREVLLTQFEDLIDRNNIVNPPWLGNEAFHQSHQSNLLRKDKNHYAKFGWEVPDNLPYVWPTKHLMGLVNPSEHTHVEKGITL